MVKKMNFKKYLKALICSVILAAPCLASDELKNSESPAPKPSVGLMSLPPEMHEEIVQHIKDPRDLGNLILVSKYWNQLAKPFIVENSVVFVGPTGSGKSTLACLFAGEQLQAFLGRPPIYQLESSHTPPAFYIEHGSFKSGTHGSHLVLDSKNNRYVIDCGGFDSSKGTNADYENALAIYKALREKVKMVLVLTEKHFEIQYGSDVLKYLDEMSQIFPEEKDLQKSLYFVVSQIHNSEMKMSDFLNELQETCKQDFWQDKPKIGRLLDFFQKNPDHVAEFYAPTEEGPYTPSESLQRLIQNKNFVHNPRINKPTSGIGGYGNRETGWLTPEKDRLEKMYQNSYSHFSDN